MYHEIKNWRLVLSKSNTKSYSSVASEGLIHHYELRSQYRHFGSRVNPGKRGSVGRWIWAIKFCEPFWYKVALS
jgi:hypothetical protein